MATPRKSMEVKLSEGKPHRSNKEINEKLKNEKAVFSGTPLKEREEVKNNPKAHKEFLNIKKILDNIGKNDNTFQGIVNRYSELMSEVDDLREQREGVKRSLEIIETKILESTDASVSKLFSNQNALNKTLMEISKQIDAKRKMINTIERDLCLTIDSASRTISTKTEEDEDPLLAALQDD